jgi:hypothetical protein
MAWSSFEVCVFSLSVGDGASFGVESDSDRAFEGDLEGLRTARTED